MVKVNFKVYLVLILILIIGLGCACYQGYVFYKLSLDNNRLKLLKEEYITLTNEIEEYTKFKVLYENVSSEEFDLVTKKDELDKKINSLNEEINSLNSKIKDVNNKIKKYV